MILAYAGRRPDPDASSSDRRFPLNNVPRVAREIERLLSTLKPSTVVGAAASGADLLVLDAAGRLGIRRRVILPFDRATFRTTSVIDRPGDWGSKFDTVVNAVSGKGDLVELTLDPKEDGTYEQANRAILDDAETLARSTGERRCALVIWNRISRGAGDVTEAFLKEAERRGRAPHEIDTLQQ